MLRHTGSRTVRTMKSRAAVSAMAVVIAMGVVAGSAAGASALKPWWNITSLAAPGHLPPGGKGKLEVFVTNVGDAGVNASAPPVKIVDKLPPGIKAEEASGSAGYRNLAGELNCEVEASGSMVSCEYHPEEGGLTPYEQLEIHIEAEISTSAGGEEVNEVAVSGGGAPPMSASESSR
jgi:hypothetical protein